MSTELFLFIAPYIIFVLVRQYYQFRASRSVTATPSAPTDYESSGSRILRNTSLNLLYIIVIIHIMNPAMISGLIHFVPVWLRTIGLALSLAGIVLLVWTHEHLGRQWSADLVIQSSHALITTGPYHWVRHPMYSALFAFFIGTALSSGNYLIEALSLVIILNILFRLPNEEKMMMEKFGDEYRAYAEKTGQFFPR
jgi:protein-S-isoprenylcysteine O-methyltransferase Ste14